MLAGIIVLILSAFGVVVEDAKVAFILYAVFTLGASGYSFYNRFQKKGFNFKRCTFSAIVYIY